MNESSSTRLHLHLLARNLGFRAQRKPLPLLLLFHYCIAVCNEKESRNSVQECLLTKTALLMGPAKEETLERIVLEWQSLQPALQAKTTLELARLLHASKETADYSGTLCHALDVENAWTPLAGYFSQKMPVTESSRTLAKQAPYLFYQAWLPYLRSQGAALYRAAVEETLPPPSLKETLTQDHALPEEYLIIQVLEGGSTSCQALYDSLRDLALSQAELAYENWCIIWGVLRYFTNEQGVELLDDSLRETLQLCGQAEYIQAAGKEVMQIRGGKGASLLPVCIERLKILSAPEEAFAFCRQLLDHSTLFLPTRVKEEIRLHYLELLSERGRLGEIREAMRSLAMLDWSQIPTSRALPLLKSLSDQLLNRPHQPELHSESLSLGWACGRAVDGEGVLWQLQADLLRRAVEFPGVEYSDPTAAQCCALALEIISRMRLQDRAEDDISSFMRGIVESVLKQKGERRFQLIAALASLAFYSPSLSQTERAKISVLISQIYREVKKLLDKNAIDGVKAAHFLHQGLPIYHPSITPKSCRGGIACDSEETLIESIEILTFLPNTDFWPFKGVELVALLMNAEGSQYEKRLCRLALRALFTAPKTSSSSSLQLVRSLLDLLLHSSKRHYVSDDDLIAIATQLPPLLHGSDSLYGGVISAELSQKLSKCNKVASKKAFLQFAIGALHQPLQYYTLWIYLMAAPNTLLKDSLQHMIVHHRGEGDFLRLLDALRCPDIRHYLTQGNAELHLQLLRRLEKESAPDHKIAQLLGQMVQLKIPTPPEHTSTALAIRRAWKDHNKMDDPIVEIGLLTALECQMRVLQMRALQELCEQALPFSQNRPPTEIAHVESREEWRKQLHKVECTEQNRKLWERCADLIDYTYCSLVSANRAPDSIVEAICALPNRNNTLEISYALSTYAALLSAAAAPLEATSNVPSKPSWGQFICHSSSAHPLTPALLHFIQRLSNQELCDHTPILLPLISLSFRQVKRLTPHTLKAWGNTLCTLLHWESRQGHDFFTYLVIRHLENELLARVPPHFRAEVCAFWVRIKDLPDEKLRIRIEGRFPWLKRKRPY